uniref:Uncharacterized protein n=1 Tax=Rhizophora mucronata TaxID=61149 RepID=A0A2P2NAF8_RHIMU
MNSNHVALAHNCEFLVCLCFKPKRTCLVHASTPRELGFRTIGRVTV